jgi:hypothetical protein
MFIAGGCAGVCAAAAVLEITIARAIAAGLRQRVQILADQHVISTSSPVRRDEPPDGSHLRREDRRDYLKTS